MGSYIRRMTLHWKIADWEELEKDDLYEMIALRIRVFIIEQNCPYQDADGKDKKSIHLSAFDEQGRCMATCRLVKPGVSYAEWSIGRVCTDETMRGNGTGRVLMERAMQYLRERGVNAIRISAQSYLQTFYGSLGFEQVSEEYLEDDIPHIEMLFTAP